MSTPLVSIIVPCYNQAKYLSETLDSVLSQSYQDWECVIVNDGSFDNTKAITQQYVNKDPRFIYIEQVHSGPSSARNNGIKVSSGKFILPLDSDDIIAPTYLEKAITVFEYNPLTALVYCKAEKFGDETGPWNLPQYNYDSFIWGNCIFCSAFFKRSDYDKTVGYNSNMEKGFEDWDLWLSILTRDSIVCQIDEVLFYYRRKASSRDTESKLHLDELYKQIYNNHPKIYEPYNEQILILKNNNITLENQFGIIYKSAKREVYNQIEYKIGAFILKPFRLIQKFFNSIIK